MVSLKIKSFKRFLRQLQFSKILYLSRDLRLYFKSKLELNSKKVELEWFINLLFLFALQAKLQVLKFCQIKNWAKITKKLLTRKISPKLDYKTLLKLSMSGKQENRKPSPKSASTVAGYKLLPTSFFSQESSTVNCISFNNASHKAFGIRLKCKFC